ncbi:hypothetical protein GCM10022251_36360 [Phytohabitans flavus]|uniref:Uncharacterized protein n=1 Tax=Phytohabitans flavus TaxID=1076124 RepID=A0A6F8XW43_9ACTN|nr:hypothetical protein [Phytohabitans flavus]BCB78064.1 hypothetical protein Pflav_044740 [Phytohabitans flavus]
MTDRTGPNEEGFAGAATTPEVMREKRTREEREEEEAEETAIPNHDLTEAISESLADGEREDHEKEHGRHDH